MAEATARPRRVFLVGFYGMHNLGDEAIRAAIVAAAPARGVEVVAVASRDRADPDPLAVPMTGLGLIRYLRAIVRADRVVLGGGGILKDEGLRIPLELCTTALAARLLRREVTLLAVGVGPFYSRPGRWLAKVTARLAQVRTVRDEDSVAELRALGVARVQLGADPTFSLDAPTSARTGDGPRRVVVSLRSWFLRAADRETRQARLRDEVAAALAPLADDGWAVEALSLYWPRDHAESLALVGDARLAGTPAGASAPDGELDWAGLLERVAGADLVVAMRYHAVAAAAGSGRPTIALAYEPKVRALAGELGLPTVLVDDPAFAARLADLVAAELAAPGTSCADPEALADLRERAALALDLALGPIAQEA